MSVFTVVSKFTSLAFGLDSTLLRPHSVHNFYLNVLNMKGYGKYTYTYIYKILLAFFFKIKSRDEMEKRTETGLVMGHAYGVTAVKKVCMSLGLKHFLVL